MQTAEVMGLVEDASLVNAEKPIHVATCHCGATVTYQPTSSGNGFMILGRSGVDAEANFGVGPNGIPVCPVDGHGEMTLADEQMPAHEAITEAAEMLKDAEQASLPGVFPAFNFQGAYLELEQQALQVDRLAREHKEDAETARDSKKRWEKAADLFTKMAVEFNRRRREKAEPIAEPEPENAGGALVECLFAERHFGAPCPLCDGSTLGLEPSEIMPRDSESHVEQAVQMLDTRDANDLTEELEEAGIVIQGRIVKTWSKDQREQVRAWLLTRSDLRPPVLGTGHIAAEVEAGAQVQACKECGAVLLQINDGDEPYQPGILVGTDCDGAGQAYPKTSRKKGGRK